tara:strand:- start:1038 stop:2315 length:1278 start_codon:yes stop_codon:yes gene_type:complete
MKYLISLFIALFFQLADADIKIQSIADNENHLYVKINTLPIIDINLSFDKGSINDGDSPGLTNLMLNSIMASNINNKKIISYFEDVGAKLSYSVDKETSSITIRSLSNLEQVVRLSSLINQAILRNDIDENILNLEKEKIIRKIRESKNSPGTILESSISEKLFENSGLSHQIIGNEKSINNISSKMILSHRNKIFNKNGLGINIVGDIDINDAKKIIRIISSKLPYLENPKKNDYQIKKANYHVEFDSSQSHLAFIIPTVTRINPDYHNLLVANYIFGGGGFGSWLMKEIREIRGLSYSVYSYLGSYKNQGYMRVSLQTENKNLKLTKKIIYEQIDRLKNFNVTEKKIEIVKRSILKNFEMRTDSNRKVLNLISAVNYLNLPLNYFEDYKNKLMSVNKASIRKALESSINFERISIISVGKSIE